MQDISPGHSSHIACSLRLRVVHMNVVNGLLGVHAVLYEVDIEAQEMGNQDLKSPKIDAFMSLENVSRPLPHETGILDTGASIYHSSLRPISLICSIQGIASLYRHSGHWSKY